MWLSLKINEYYKKAQYSMSIIIIILIAFLITQSSYMLMHKLRNLK